MPTVAQLRTEAKALGCRLSDYKDLLKPALEKFVTCARQAKSAPANTLPTAQTAPVAQQEALAALEPENASTGNQPLPSTVAAAPLARSNSPAALAAGHQAGGPSTGQHSRSTSQQSGGRDGPVAEDFDFPVDLDATCGGTAENREQEDQGLEQERGDREDHLSDEEDEGNESMDLILHKQREIKATMQNLTSKLDSLQEEFSDLKWQLKSKKDMKKYRPHL